MGLEQGLRVKIARDTDGSLVALFVDFPGCFASGDDLEELREAMSEALSMYLSRDQLTITVTIGPFEFDEHDLDDHKELALAL